MTQLNLRINGQPWPFYSATIDFNIDTLAHSFNASIKDLRIDKPLPIEWFLDKELIFKGQIDNVQEGATATSQRQSITGRSQSANFIDSSFKIDAIYGQSVQSILKSLIKNYGLTVVDHAKNTDLVSEFQLNAESALNGISQLAKHRNLMLIEQPGQINIQRPGQFQVKDLVLEEGINFSVVNFVQNFAEQFYRYEVQGAWDDAEAFEIDDRINKNRQNIIIADKLQDQKACQDRAKYEKNLAISKGLFVNGTIPGLQKTLTSSTLNKVISVRSKKRSINETMLIKGISLNVTDKMESTTINLCRPFSVSAS